MKRFTTSIQYISSAVNYCYVGHFYFEYSYSYSFASVTDSGHLYVLTDNCNCKRPLQWLCLNVMLSRVRQKMSSSTIAAASVHHSSHVVGRTFASLNHSGQFCHLCHPHHPGQQRCLSAAVITGSGCSHSHKIYRCRDCLITHSFVLLDQLLLSQHNLPISICSPPHTAVSFCSLCLPIAPALSPLP